MIKSTSSQCEQPLVRLCLSPVLRYMDTAPRKLSLVGFMTTDCEAVAFLGGRGSFRNMDQLKPSGSASNTDFIRASGDQFTQGFFMPWSLPASKVGLVTKSVCVETGRIDGLSCGMPNLIQFNHISENFDVQAVYIEDQVKTSPWQSEGQKNFVCIEGA